MQREVIVLVNSSRGKVVKPLGQKPRCYAVGSSSDYKEFDTMKEALVCARAIHKGVLSRYMNTWRKGVSQDIEALTSFTKWRDSAVVDANFFS